MPLTQKQIADIADGQESAREFRRFPEDLVGRVTSVTVTPDQATMQLKSRDKTTEVILYSDDVEPGSLTPRDGMWRGAILGLAQRALTHQHEVTVSTVETRISTIHVWIALGLTMSNQAE